VKTSKIYIFFCLFGIALIAAVTILVTQRYDPTGRTNLGAIVGGVCALIYLGCIILYWFIKILFKGTGSPDQETIGDVGGSSNFVFLKNWKSLFLAMADPNDAEARRISRGLRWHVILSFAITSAMVMTLTGGALLLNWGSSGKLIPALWLILPAWLAAQILIFIKARGNFDRLMKGLGLSPAGGPIGLSSILETEVVYGGTRHGKPVGIGVGQSGSVAWMEEPMPKFTATCRASGFQFEGAAPLELRRWCESLPRLQVWKDSEITAGERGLAVCRPVIGTYLWLYDLWLAENMVQRSRA